ncbi:hypothetical protein GALL_301000 [mine drainage metagenome]|uniref:DUF2029 domain-containing protein n=1 Tax=mine drainage metagenome TaxID=410659 RepID=A0A1J5QWS2_9ZZZZ
MRIDKRHGLLLLALLCIGQLLATVFFFLSFKRHGYLPSPFVYDKTDTFMDLFNTMFWAGHEGRYETWKSVYPPFVFLLLDAVRNMFVPPMTYPSPHALRSGAHGLQLALVAAYFVLPALALGLRIWDDFNLKEKLLLYVTAVSSLPFLFALERGNLILLATPLLTLLLGKSPRWRVLALMLLINIKPYFALLLFAYVAKKYWDELFVAVLATGAMYLVTATLINANFTSMLFNLVSFGQNANVFSLREMLSFPSSVSAFAAVLSTSRFIDSKYAIDWLNATWLAGFIEICKWGLIAWALAALFRVGKEIGICAVFAVLIVITTNLSTSVGGYSLIFYFALIPVIKGLRYAPVYFLLLAAIYLPLDPILPLVRNDIGTQISFLAGRAVDVHWTLGLATALRPWLNLLLLAVMAFEFSRSHIPASVLSQPARSPTNLSETCES